MRTSWRHVICYLIYVSNFNWADSVFNWLGHCSIAHTILLHWIQQEKFSVFLIEIGVGQLKPGHWVFAFCIHCHRGSPLKEMCDIDKVLSDVKCFSAFGTHWISTACKNTWCAAIKTVLQCLAFGYQCARCLDLCSDRCHVYDSRLHQLC